jgi:biofilm PGA synthesis lipoprotein PgaB
MGYDRASNKCLLTVLTAFHANMFGSVECCIVNLAQIYRSETLPPPASTLPPIYPTARRRADGRPTTLLVWHDIVSHDKDKLVWFDTTIAEFDAQLARLARAGIRPISLNLLYRYLASGTPVPPPGAALLCFDDNTAGIRQYAAPRLRQRGWPFVVSAHTAYIGKTTSKAHNTFVALKEMEAMGATIVSQTHTHPPDLRALSDAALAQEMTESRRRMEAGLGHAVTYLTYPSGKWDRRIALAAQAAGYRMALTEDYGAAESSPHLLGVHRYSTHRRFDEALRSVTHAAASRSS